MWKWQSNPHYKSKTISCILNWVAFWTMYNCTSMNLFVRNHLFIQLDIREFWRGFRTTIGTIIKVFSIENGIFNTKQQFSIKLYILIIIHIVSMQSNGKHFLLISRLCFMVLDSINNRLKRDYQFPQKRIWVSIIPCWNWRIQWQQ